MGTYLNLTGQLYGRLTPVRVVGQAPCGSMLWECVCSCAGASGFPGVKTTSTRKLREKSVESCGCLKAEREKIGRTKGNAVQAARANRSTRTLLGTRIIRREGVTRHSMDAINDGGKSMTHPGPSRYGRPDMFAFAWPAAGTVGVEA